MSVINSLDRLQYLCNVIPSLLEKIPELEFSFKPTPTKWSKKEILGHLIDSATNNHQRFIRIQYENEPVIFYDQNHWNALSNYNMIDSAQLIMFWKSYNQHLLEIIKAIPEENLNKTGIGKDGQKFSLAFYVSDYVQHLEHHLTQIVGY